MKNKNLFVLVVLAVALGAWAWWSNHPKIGLAPAAMGAKVLPDLPVNDVATIQMTTAATNLTLAKEQGAWVVVSRKKYPANFDKIADMLKDLRELKVGQVMAVTEKQRGQFKLMDPVPLSTPSVADTQGTRVELFGANNKRLGSLLVGKTFMKKQAGGGMEGMPNFGGYPMGQYVRTDKGQVYLVAKTLERMTESANTWLDDAFVNVLAADIRELTVTGPDRAAIRLWRTNDTDAMTIDGLKESEGTADAAKITQQCGGLNYLSFDDIAVADLSDKDTGMGAPVVYKAVTKEGMVYTLRIGQAVGPDRPDRYVKVGVSYDPALDVTPAVSPDVTAAASNAPPAADKAKQATDDKAKRAEAAKTANAKFEPWLYIVKQYRVEPLLLKRDELVKKPEPPPAPTPGTNTVAEAVKAQPESVPAPAVPQPPQAPSEMAVK